MKRLIVLLILSTSSLFGQDNPMFDSVDYFLRNKIKVIHEYHASWYYGLPWEYVKLSFDKNSRTLRLDSMKFNDPESPMAKGFKPGGVSDFVFRDTVTTRQDGLKDTLKYIFDNKHRLKLRVHKSWSANPKNHSISAQPKDLIPHVTTWTYIYEDSVSKKLKRIITESPYFISTKNFYYSKSFLSTTTCLDSNKLSNKINFETMSYDYYLDKKIKRQTRRVTSDHCPTICEGTIEYKYETEFKNDSTPSGIKPISYTTLITIENKKKSNICVEFFGYPSDKNKGSLWLVPRIAPDSTYEIIFDARPDQGIYPRKQYTYWSYKRDKFKEFGILVYPKPDDNSTSVPKDTLFFEKLKIESLFKTPKAIKITDKR